MSADIYILVYDVTSQTSFNFIKVLRENILSVRSATDCQFVVVANKIDKLRNGDISKIEDISKQSKTIQDLVRNGFILV